VDAFPSDIFKGDVRQIRLQPVVTSNVVTYTVIVNAPNPEKKLMPGMTANITVLVQKVDSVPVVSGRALRFTPDAAFLSEYFKNNPPVRGQGPGGQQRQRTGGTEGQNNAGMFQTGTQPGKRPDVVWVKSGDSIHRTRITTGAIDATNIEIKSGLKEGDNVILSMTQSNPSAASTTTTTRSPFMPQRPGTTRR
jgi:HlyD family secretion protein